MMHQAGARTVLLDGPPKALDSLWIHPI